MREFRNCLIFINSKVEPTSGFRVKCIPMPPVPPEVIHIQVFQTCFPKTLKGFNLNNRGCKPTGNEINKVLTLKGLNIKLGKLNEI